MGEEKPTHKKNTLLQVAQATLEPKLAREYFFLPTKKKFFLPFFFLNFFRHRTDYVFNRTDSASNVNRFLGQFCADIGQTLFHCKKSGDTHNKGLAKAGGQWVIEQLCFLFTLVLGDSEVLFNARLRQAPNR